MQATWNFGAATGPHCRVAFVTPIGRRKPWVHALTLSGGRLYWSRVRKGLSAHTKLMGAEPVTYWHDGEITAPGLPNAREA